MKVRLISKSHGVDGKSPSELIGYCARVSNPANQDNPDVARLLKYCFKHGHFSIFEMADFTFEIITSRAIAAQILRHRHFNFQEFSQRYSAVQAFEMYEPRMQDVKNKQNSLETDDSELKDWFHQMQTDVIEYSKVKYDEALDKGIAKEQARFLLPMNVQTKMYMKGSLRSWIHYLSLRLHESTQKEHRDIAAAIFDILSKEVPVIGELISEYSTLTSNPYG